MYSQKLKRDNLIGIGFQTIKSFTKEVKHIYEPHILKMAISTLAYEDKISCLFQENLVKCVIILFPGKVFSK